MMRFCTAWLLTGTQPTNSLLSGVLPHLSRCCRMCCWTATERQRWDLGKEQQGNTYRGLQGPLSGLWHYILVSHLCLPLACLHLPSEERKLGDHVLSVASFAGGVQLADVGHAHLAQPAGDAEADSASNGSSSFVGTLAWAGERPARCCSSQGSSLCGSSVTSLS